MLQLCTAVSINQVSVVAAENPLSGQLPDGLQREVIIQLEKAEDDAGGRGKDQPNTIQYSTVLIYNLFWIKLGFFL